MIYIPMKVRHEVKALAAGRIFEFYITDDIKPDGERFLGGSGEHNVPAVFRG